MCSQHVRFRSEAVFGSSAQKAFYNLSKEEEKRTTFTRADFWDSPRFGAPEVTVWAIFTPVKFQPTGVRTGLGIPSSGWVGLTQANPVGVTMGKLPRLWETEICAFDSNAIPSVIEANWHRIRHSKLPERVFNELITAATSMERKKAAPLSNISLQVFLNVWQSVHLFAAEPVVSISSTGFVVAEWFEDADNSLVIMVNGSGDILYSLFTVGTPYEGAIGHAELDELVDTIRAHEPNPFTWSDAE